MTVVKYRLFFAWNFEKEEQWLDKMSGTGLQLADVAVVRYRFDTDRSKRYRYRLEPPADDKGTTHDEPQTDTGMEYVCSTNGWAYYRKEVGPDEPEPHADLDSKIAQYSRLLAVFGILAVNALVLLVNSLYTLFDIYIVNVAVIVVLSLSSLVAVLGLVQVYWKVTRLKKEKGASR